MRGLATLSRGPSREAEDCIGQWSTLSSAEKVISGRGHRPVVDASFRGEREVTLLLARLRKGCRLVGHPARRRGVASAYLVEGMTSAA